MGEPFCYRCEVTQGFLDRAEPELHAALLARHDRAVPARQAQLRPLLAADGEAPA